MESDKKNILVIGSTSDMGRTLITSMDEERYAITATGTNSKLPSELPDTVTYIQLDILNTESVEQFWKQIKETGTYDWVVYFPGIIDADERGKLSDTQYLEDSFTVNTLFPMMLSDKLKDQLTDTGGIIFISSTAAVSPSGFFPVYSAGKAALNAFAQSLQRYWGDLGKKTGVFVICPGPTNTKMREAIAHDADQHQSPQTIAELLNSIITQKESFTETVYVIRDGSITPSI